VSNIDVNLIQQRASKQTSIVVKNSPQAILIANSFAHEIMAELNMTTQMTATP